MFDRYQIIKRNDVDSCLWDTFVQGNSQCWLWHQSALVEAISCWHNSEDASFAVFGLQGEKLNLVAILPMRKINKKFGGLLNFFVYESLSGPALKDDLTSKVLKRIIKEINFHLDEMCNHHFCMGVRLFCSPLAQIYQQRGSLEINPLLAFGSYDISSLTWVVDLKCDDEGLWSALKGSARTAIRKSQRLNVQIKEGNISHINAYFALHEETCRRNGIKPHPFEYFRALWSFCVERGTLKIFLAEWNGVIVAIETFGVFKEAAVYLTGAASNDGLRCEANSLIQWHAIKWLKTGGVEIYDNGEAFPFSKDKKKRALSNFKQSFGGKLRPLPRVVRYKRGLLSTPYNFLNCFKRGL